MLSEQFIILFIIDTDLNAGGTSHCQALIWSDFVIVLALLTFISNDQAEIFGVLDKMRKININKL